MGISSVGAKLMGMGKENKGPSLKDMGRAGAGVMMLKLLPKS